MDGASSLQKQNRLILPHSFTTSTPLQQLASAFCCTTDEIKSYIDFEMAERDDIDDEVPQAPGFQAIPSTNQAKDTLLSIVNPHLWRNQCQRSYWSQQRNLLSLDHGKLLAEATRNSEVSTCSPQPEPPNISRISGTRASSVSSGVRPSSIKRRLKWTADLHEKFVDCVNLLGGPEKATPRAILKLMKSNGLTVLHVKSHLQKYRYAKCITGSRQEKSDQRVDDDDDDLPMPYLKSGMQVKEILQMQLQVQRHLGQQLEIQQNLQQAIEEQGKQVQMMLEQLKKTNKAC